MGVASSGPFAAHAWILRSGEEMLSKLRGRFAVVVWDGRRDRVVAARDPLGTYPLFWGTTGGTVILSSAAKAVAAFPGVSGELNRAALADHMCHRWPDPEETFFTSVRRVPAAHALTDAGGHRTLHRIWSLPSEQDAGWADPDEVEEFDDRFELAVQRCLRLGPVGISLSGGLDSVSVAAYASNATEIAKMPNPIALSLRFPDPSCDEEQVQRSVADQLNFPMLMLEIEDVTSGQGVLGTALELAETWPLPIYNPWLAPYLVLYEMGINEGCKAVLSGGGGDEWLCVSPFLAADMLARLDVAGVIRLMQSARTSTSMPSRRIPHSYLWRFGLRPLLGRELVRRAPRLVESRDRRHLARSTPDWLAPDPGVRNDLSSRYVPRSETRSFYEREGRTSLDHPLVAMDYEEVHEQGRQLGAPVLAPFLDVDLIELLSRIPPEALNQDGRSKGMVRWALDRRFPDLAFGSQKKVTAIPYVGRLLSEEGPHVWERYGPPSALSKLGVVDLEILEPLASRCFAAGSFRDRFMLFRLFCLEMFVRRLV